MNPAPKIPASSFHLPFYKAILAGVVLAASLQGCAKQSECTSIATEKQATTLLTRLMPEAKLISFEPLALDDKKTTCLLEVEMFADKNDEQTKGFVYVLPGGERFLNGPLMDKRSQLAISKGRSISPDLEAALQAQKATINSAMAKLSSLGQGAAAETSDATLAAQTALLDSETESGAWGQFLEKVQTLPSFQTQASGSDVYVMFDPLCSYCSQLYKQHEELSKRYGLRFHWIPMFLSDKGWAMSAHLLKTGRHSNEEGLLLLDKMLKKTWKPADDAQAIASLTEEDYGYAKKASLEFYEQSKVATGLGTPLVLFMSPAGEIKHIAGVPEQTDWEVFATKTKP